MKKTIAHPFLSGPALVFSTMTLLQPAYAEHAGPGVVKMDTMVITAGRRAQDINDVQASIEVIGQDKIKTFPGTSVTEILRQAVGIDARSSGSNSSIAIRGQAPNAASSPVLILIDGLPRTSQNGIANLNNFPVEDVERIEVIRGPMSVLYGANAAGGVINIITKTPGEGSPVAVRFTAGNSLSNEGDGRETYGLAASVNGQTGNVGHRLSIDLRDLDNFQFDNNDLDDDLANLKHYSLAYSGLAELNHLGNLRWTLEGYKQDDNSLRSSRGTAYEGFEEEDRYFGALVYENDIGPGSLRLEGSYGNSNADSIRSPTLSVETTKFKQTFLQGHYFLPIGDHGILAGIGRQSDEIDLTVLSTVGEESNRFAYIQDDWNITDDIKIVAGLRLDDFDSFGTQTVPRISIGSRGAGLTWRLGYGEAFRAPTVLERFSQFGRGPTLVVGTENLNPEETETWEAAIGWAGHRGNIELVFHDSNIDNLIESRRTAETAPGFRNVSRYLNVAEAEISGIELIGQYDIGAGFSVNGAYEYLDAIDGSTKQRLQGRARNTYRINLNWDQGPWGIALRGRHLNSNFNIRTFGGTPINSNYTVADIQARYQVTADLNVAVGVENIFDHLTPGNWSAFGGTEDPAGRYGYVTFNYAMGEH